MKILKLIVITVTLIPLLALSQITPDGGDDAGNGGFAYKQSIRILKKASKQLSKQIKLTTFRDIKDYPNRKKILLKALQYNNLIQEPRTIRYRGNRLLAMDYSKTLESVKVYKPFYESFSGTTDDHFNSAVKEVKKRLVHEASHIWGFNEQRSEEFSIDFISYQERYDTDSTRDDIMLDSRICACRRGKQVSNGEDCQNYCSQYNSTKRTLHLYFKVSQEDQNQRDINNLDQWCNKTISNGNGSTYHPKPYCYLEIIDNRNNKLKFDTNTKEHKLTTFIDLLETSHTYRVKLISSTGATSNQFQLRLQDSSPNTILRPLWTDSTHSYQCLNKNNNKKNTFYFNKTIQPEISSPTNNFVCHDTDIYGEDDDHSIPRLNLKQDLFQLWSSLDPLFWDIDGNGVSEVNDQIMDFIYKQTGKHINISLFKNLKHNISPIQRAHNLGYFMHVFTDETNLKGYCPKVSDYYGADPIYSALREIIGINTQKLFLAQNAQTFKDKVYLAQSMVEKVWFIQKFGERIKPNQEELLKERVLFYWPLNIKNPYKKHKGQELYRVMRHTSSEHKHLAIGCIPKI